MAIDQATALQILAALPDAVVRHVYPEFGRPHLTDQRTGCWCEPWVDIAFCDEEHVAGAVIVHQSDH